MKSLEGKIALGLVRADKRKTAEVVGNDPIDLFGCLPAPEIALASLDMDKRQIGVTRRYGRGRGRVGVAVGGIASGRSAATILFSNGSILPIESSSGPDPRPR